MPIQIETPIGSFRWHENWVSVAGSSADNGSSAGNITGRTHGVAVSRTGQVLIFHQAIPSLLIYDAEGSLLTSWGNYPGAHGLTLVEEEGVEFVWLTDQECAVVEKVTLGGQVVLSLVPPPYAGQKPYVPTWVAVNELRHGGNGDVWVADGYGSNYVNRYDAAGIYLSSLEGVIEGKPFACPHGIWFDTRKRPMELYVADRANHRVQVYDADGQYLRTFGSDYLISPDGFALYGDHLLVPELEGRVTLLAADDSLVGSFGCNDEVCRDPAWPDGTVLVPGRFNSPHAATANNSDIYAVEWRTGGRVIKLEHIRTDA